MPDTSNGKFLRAIAVRDQASFDHWRSVIQEDGEDGLLGDLLRDSVEELAQRRFAKDCDVAEITRFIIENPFPFIDKDQFSSTVILDAEALIRAALGEPGLPEGIDRRAALNIHYQLLGLLVQDLGLTDSEVDDLISAMEQRVNSHRPTARRRWRRRGHSS